MIGPNVYFKEIYRKIKDTSTHYYCNLFTERPIKFTSGVNRR